MQSLPDHPLQTRPAFPRYSQGHEANTSHMVLPGRDSSPVSSDSGTYYFTRRDLSPWNMPSLLRRTKQKGSPPAHPPFAKAEVPGESGTISILTNVMTL